MLNQHFETKRTQISFSKYYFISISVLPLFIGLISVLFLLVYIFTLSLRCCSHSLSCRPVMVTNISSNNENYRNWLISIENRRFVLLSTFIVLILVILTTLSFIFYSNSSLNIGILSIRDSLLDLLNITIDITNILFEVTNLSDNISSDLSSATCLSSEQVNITPIINNLESISNYTHFIASIIQNLANSLQYIRIQLYSYGYSVKNIIISLIYGIIVIILAIKSFGLYFLSKCTLQTAIGFTIPMILLFIIVYSLHLIVLVSNLFYFKSI